MSEANGRSTPPPRRAGQLVMFLVLLAIGVPLSADLYVELRWFDSVGHSEVFSGVLATKLVVGLAVALVTGAALLLNARLAFATARGFPPLHLYDPDGVPRVNLARVVERLTVPGAVVLGALTGLVHHARWDEWLLYLNRVPFGTRDPIFGHDVGFYVFELPVWSGLVALATWVCGLCLFASTVSYVVSGAIAVGDGPPRLARAARVHLSVLAAVLLGVLAVNAYLEMFDTLYSQVGPMTGASYADVNAKLPALRLKVGLAAVAAVLVLAGINRENLTFAIIAIVLYVGAQLGVQGYPSMVHRFSVLPNELEREAPYLAHNIQATRAAYALDSVLERELSAENTLSADDIERNGATIDNVRLWDHQPLLDTFAQIQEIRTYYDFASVDNDRYMIDGVLRQTMLSPRELAASSLPNRTWINERFVFTHGYGLTLGPVNETTEEGLPVLMVQDIPPTSNTPSIKVTQPSIYFGELVSDYVFVRTRDSEFHYPSGEGNVETEYDGEDGVRFDSAFARLAIAIRLGSLKLLLSNDIDTDSRVLMYRNITERVRKVAPFLEFDSDPYMVVRDDGTLAWIYDAYTTSDRYPYAEPVRGGINYIRNSVKIVVDAYNGTITPYAVDEKDPVLAAWRKVFPTTFRALSEMPKDLRAHLRYPEQIFAIQAEMFTTYHMAEAQLLYNREDQWEVPTISAQESKQKMSPYYTVMKLPEGTDEEFILMLPFTPKRKDNLAAWMVARSDGEHLGELVVYNFPKDRLVFGPQQVINRINQDAEISRQISLWDQRGSEALFGTLLVVPIEESLIYVRPLYLRSEGGKIPELKRVVVAYEKQIAMEPSLREAINAIFGGGSPGAPGPAPSSAAAATEPSEPGSQAADAQAPSKPAVGAPTGGSVETRALQHFERAIHAQRAGDWAAYGRELEEVEKLLRVMQPVPTGPAEKVPAAKAPEAAAPIAPTPVVPAPTSAAPSAPSP